MQISLSEEEQKEITRCITNITSILMGQHNKGVASPNIDGTVKVKGEKIEVVFDIKLQPIKKVKK